MPTVAEVYETTRTSKPALMDVSEFDYSEIDKRNHHLF